MMSLGVIAAAVAAGVSTHLGYFIRGEHHLYGTKYIQALLSGFIFTTILQVRIYDKTLITSIISAITLTFYYLSGLYTSLLLYRLLFHPLKRFPGPIGNKLGNLWFSFQLSKGDAYKKVRALHQRYGNFVRIGSSDLSIIHPKAVSIIYGVGTKCNRAAFYNGDPIPSMISSRDRKKHDIRRRVWSPAFSDKALQGYAQRTKMYDVQLVGRIEDAAASGAALNVSKWFNYYSFDVMGELAFGKSFDMLKSGEEHWALKLMNTGLEALCFLFPVWLFRVLISVPGLMRDHSRITEFCNGQVDMRIKAKVEIPDIMSTLLAPFSEDKPPAGQDLLMLQGDSRLIVIAGSDTTAATLTRLFYELAKDPKQVSRLRQEIAPVWIADDPEALYIKLQYLDHLNGVINETLRLHPPVPTAIPRLTPPEGIRIGETFVPGDITVWCPPYVMGRSEDIYQDATLFVPERWYSKTELVKEKAAFSPFMTGPYGCIGKPLALMQIRTIVAKIVMQFDVGFADGEDGTNILENSRDHFTMGLADLNLVFRKR